MRGAGFTFQRITAALAMILAIVKIVAYLTGAGHHVAYTSPSFPPVSSPPMTAEQKAAADENGRAVAKAYAEAKKLFDEARPPK